ncbi:MAG: hypothetical protein CVV64_10075 [Candidatus Wallbacteria bacterium HGW-Wallbacteria-1]|jgi:indolepyruvate ferredoxin oxidoreductase alpha subunit|uniref:4Fe-4S ferredoxin-type domain-containing protein n=1 Tax=Candidatus Wallbacteria bacterium HGW-Wallbacteria-1 TaxID=2013854 RepID=A0A2N1PPP6_9BACT|nr:MAG: hypothetical protein CVV64_10075 [Candidatus Wallbacteria bacterium HGW-Wallbacteria-1]
MSFSNVFSESDSGCRLILSGAGAVARGAFEAGVGLVVTYPGSPVVETYDLLASALPDTGGIARIVINEHVAFHTALGYSLSGGRSLVVMKHVGLNVCADPAHYSAYTGVKGGMVIVVGTDPGSTCSTGEFDARFYSLHTHLPILEPWDFDHARELTRRAFEMSEKLSLPVIILIPSSFCYGMGPVISDSPLPRRKKLFFSHDLNLTSVGASAVALHQRLHGKIESLLAMKPGEIMPLSDSFFFQPAPGKVDSPQKGTTDLLIVTSGIYRDFVREALSYLGIRAQSAALYSPAMTYPFPGSELIAYVEDLGRPDVFFVEDLDGFLQLQGSAALASAGISVKIHGKEFIPCWGKLDFQGVMKGLEQALDRFSSTADSMEGLPDQVTVPGCSVQSTRVPSREGTFCPGCPHRAFFYTLKDVLEPDDIIGGDIGCSSLPPHFSDWLTCMNSGPSIAMGVSLALNGFSGAPRVVSLIGDSTLFHSGLQTIIEAAQTDSRQVCFILDNSWTAMTGHQPTPGTRRQIDGSVKPGSVDIHDLLKACGVNRIFRVDPLNMEMTRRVIFQALENPGFVCVLVEHECKLQQLRRGAEQQWSTAFQIVPQRCVQCGKCYSELTCPAIVRDDQGMFGIDQEKCHNCGACAQICSNGAIIPFSVRAFDFHSKTECGMVRKFEP